MFRSHTLEDPVAITASACCASQCALSWFQRKLKHNTGSGIYAVQSSWPFDQAVPASNLIVVIVCHIKSWSKAQCQIRRVFIKHCRKRLRYHTRPSVLHYLVAIVPEVASSYITVIVHQMGFIMSIWYRHTHGDHSLRLNVIVADCHPRPFLMFGYKIRAAWQDTFPTLSFLPSASPPWKLCR